MTREEEHIDSQFEKQFDEFWEQSKINPKPNTNADALYESISKEISFNSKGKRNIKFSHLKYAAVFIGFLAISSILYYQTTKNHTLAIESIVVDSGNTKRDILLPDNSTVKLFEQSSLIFPNAFDSISRSVTLKGSAFFDITENASKPFLVNSKNIVAKVLGTSFTIEAVDSLSIVRVSLHSGKLEVSNIKKSIKEILLPGDVLVYDIKKDEVERNTSLNPKVDIKEVVLQTTSMNFENIQLSKAYKLLSEEIGVFIDTMGLRANSNFYISLEYQNKSIDKILNDLNSFGGYEYIIEDDKIIIK